MPKPLISIIVPIYNVEQYLAQCLESLELQSCHDFVVLLVNDGSTDSSEDIAKQFVARNPNKFQLFNKINGGLSDARNFAIDKVTTEYMIFLDSDDYLTLDTIEVLSNSIKTSSADILCFGMVEVTETGKFTRNIPPASIKHSPTNLIESPNLLTTALPNACNKLMKTNLFTDNNLRFPKGLWYEDLATIPLLFSKSKKIEFIENNLYLYRNREGSITQTISPKIMDMLNVLNIINTYFHKKDINIKLQRALTTLTVNMLMKTMVRIASSSDKAQQKNMQTQLKQFLKDNLTKPSHSIIGCDSKAIYKLINLAVLYGFNRPVITFINLCQKYGILR